MWLGGRYECADAAEARALYTRLRNALGADALIGTLVIHDETRCTMRGRTTREELDAVLGDP